MKPSTKEFAAAIKEEAAAVKQFSADLHAETEAILKLRASRHRLMLARSAKAVLFQDLMSYGNYRNYKANKNIYDTHTTEEEQEF